MNYKVLLIIIMIIFAATVILFAFPHKISINCEDDENCIQYTSNLREDCIPSESIMIREVPEGNLTILINVTRVGNDCIITEEILDMNLLEGEEFTPHDIRCIVPLEFIGLPYNCEGSFLGEGSDGDEESENQINSTIIIICSAEDLECKATALGYIQSCTNSEISDTERIWTESSYWTKYIIVQSEGQSCHLNIEIIDVISPPSHIPPDIVGMSVDCYFPIDPVGDPPVENLTLDYCLGDLFEFLYD